jgi:AGZA family xanthine/uracil permease-like MFS transporter
MGQAARIAWSDATEALPAFVTIVLIPFTFNIAHGVAGGLVAYAVVKAGAGRGREVAPVVWVLAGVLLLAYAFLPTLRH